MKITKKSKNGRFFKSETSLISIKRPIKGEEKEISNYQIKISPTPKDTNILTESIGDYFSNRLQNFLNYLTNPFLLILFIIFSIFDLIKYSNYYISALTILILIEYLTIKNIEKRLIKNMKEKESRKIFKTGQTLSFATGVYILTALILIYFQFRIFFVR